MTSYTSFSDTTTNASSKIKLFCFPNAGGTTARYITWSKRLPATIEVIPVAYPGRGPKSAAPLCESLEVLLQALLIEIEPQLTPPFYFFGHSMGATVAFELGCKLQKLGYPLPSTVFISGRRAPSCVQPPELLHLLPDPQLIRALQTFNGIPATLLERSDVLKYFLPIIRADLQALETWHPPSSEKLGCNFCISGGTHDPLAPFAGLSAWRNHSSGSTKINMFPGGHFYLDEQTNEVIAMITRTLGFKG